MAVGMNIVYSPSRYEGETSKEHIDPLMVHMGDNAMRAAKHRARVDFNRTPPEFNNSLDGLHCWGNVVMHAVPAGVDLALDVDDGGNTRRDYEPSVFSHWAESDMSGVFLRFSEARTAVHGFGLLRSPVMGGIALESTTSPDSTDIRDAHTMLIVGAKKEKDARYPWIEPKPTTLYDMSEFDVNPLYVGPLYGGHPNEIKSRVRQMQVVELGLGIFEKLIF